MAPTTKLPALLLILSILLSTTTPILGCGSCSNPHHKPPKTKPPKVKPPSIRPPVVPVRPPVVPVRPPVVPVRPPVVPVLPPVVPVLPPGILPPILPPGTVPGNPNCPPGTPVPSLPPVPSKPPAAPTCPIDTLKLGACVDLLGGLVHIIIGNPVVNQCCPLIQGLADLEAAVCLCTTIKLKLLNINLYLPLALQLLLTCGKSPPPGFTCSI